MCIISTYLPSNHDDLLMRTQRQLNNWIDEIKTKNWHSLIMGDFNTNTSTKKKKYTLFSKLQFASFSSLLEFYNISTPTWQRQELTSQIDDIWASSDILLDVDTPILSDAIGISDSDHKIINTT